MKNFGMVGVAVLSLFASFSGAQASETVQHNWSMSCTSIRVGADGQKTAPAGSQLSALLRYEKKGSRVTGSLQLGAARIDFVTMKTERAPLGKAYLSPGIPNSVTYFERKGRDSRDFPVILVNYPKAPNVLGVVQFEEMGLVSIDYNIETKTAIVTEHCGAGVGVPVVPGVVQSLDMANDPYKLGNDVSTQYKRYLDDGIFTR